MSWGVAHGEALAYGQGGSETCDRVLIIGLSLREADYQTRWLLRTALAAGQPRDVEIDIVNPNSADRDRLRSFFQDLGRVVPYETVDKFLAGRPARTDRSPVGA